MELAVVEVVSREGLKAETDRGDGFVLSEALSRRHHGGSLLSGAPDLPNEFADAIGNWRPDRVGSTRSLG